MFRTIQGFLQTIRNTQAINKRYARIGSLFERPFHRIEVPSDTYFRQLVTYVHLNPVHHGFTADFKYYLWSSYGTIISAKLTRLCRDAVVGWFDDQANFVEVHRRKLDMELINDLLIE